jgi:hypothetical protein
MKVKKNTNTYLSTMLVSYPINKPIEKQLEESSDALREEAYKLAQPVQHIFKLKYMGL